MTRKYWTSVIGVLAVLLATIWYIAARVLDVPIAGGSTTVSVALPRTGGLYEGSAVTLRGVAIGTVTKLALDEGRVVATIRLDPGRNVPRDSPVRVRSLSPIGEQYLDFQPASSAGPYLRDGDHVSADSIDLPQSLADMAIAVDDLMGQIDVDRLRSMLSELEGGLGDRADDLRLMLDQGSALLERIDEAFPATKRLVENGRELLVLAADLGDELVRSARSARAFTTWLVRYQPELVRLLEKGPGQIEELRSLIRALDRDLPAFLGQAGSLTDLIAARDPHFRELFIRYAGGIGTLAGAFQGKYVLIDFLFQRGPQCRYGAKERSPHDLNYRPVDGSHGCSRQLSFAQRGSQWVPQPVG